MAKTATPKQKAARARNLKPFPKGKSGNPGGRPVNAELGKLRVLTHEDLVKSASELWFKTAEELRQMIPSKTHEADPTHPSHKVPIGKAVIASVLLHAVKFGDQHRLDSILNRIIGKAPDTIKLLGAFAHQHSVTLPVAEFLANPELSSRALELSESVAQMLVAKNREANPEAAQAAIESHREPDDA